MPDSRVTGTTPESSRKVIFGSIAVSIAFVMELTLVPLLLPAIQRQFGLSIGELAWVFNSYGIAVAVGVLLGGWLGDVFNTRRVFGIGVLFFAAGSAVVAYAGRYDVVLAGRVLQGFGGGVFSPLIPLLLTRSSPNRPGKILIIWGSVAGYVAAFAPFFYGSTLAIYGWNLAFVIFVIVSLGALTVFPTSRSQNEPRRTAISHPSYSKLLESPGLWLMYGYVFCTYGAITYFLFRLPLWLAENHFQTSSIGLNLSIMWLSFSLLSTFLRNKVDGPHVRGILLTAPVLIAAGFPLAYFCQNFFCLILASMCIGSGLACSNAPSTQLVLRFAPERMSAISISLDITFARLGGVASVALLAQSMFGYAVVAAVVISFIAFLCALAAVRLFDQ